MLRSIPTLRNLVHMLDLPGQMLCMLTDQSGRSALDWLPTGYTLPGRNTITAEEREQRIASLIAQHMPNARDLALHIRRIFQRIDPADHSTPVTVAELGQLVHALQVYNPDADVWGNAMNDPAELHAEMINCLMLVTDRSTPAGRNAIAIREVHVDGYRLNNEPPPGLAQDCAEALEAYNSEGHDTPISRLFLHQCVKESICGELLCSRVKRNIQHDHILQLPLPAEQGETSTWQLNDLL